MSLDSILIPGTSTLLSEVARIQQSPEKISVTLGFPSNTIASELQAAITQATHCPSIEIHTHIGRHKIQQGPSAHPKIKNIIAIASGKGGVGKSTVCTNLAVMLSKMGARVGLLDADIYGPSQPTMLAINHSPESKDRKSIEPIVKYGLWTMSIGYLIDSEQAVIWRGPMVSGALQQLLNDTQWPELDYLLIDLPPGTGDIQLTLSQKVPVSGAVIVTTPQDLALQDVKRAVHMFNKVSIPVLGVIENMSSYHCPHCGHEDALFGEHGGQHMADSFSIPLLAQIPLAKSIREHSDSGDPIALYYPENNLSQAYHLAALKLSMTLSQQKRHYGVNLPKVTVENALRTKE